jgi:hypothetical protein
MTRAQIPARRSICSRLSMISRIAGPFFVCVLILTVAGPISGASAEGFGIVPGSFAVHMSDPESSAGSHPDMQVDFGFEGEPPEEMLFEMPPGFGGEPNAVAACSQATRAAGEECPSDSQVGMLTLGPVDGLELTLPIYRVESDPGEAPAFGSRTGIDVRSTMQVRPADLGITVAVVLPEFSVPSQLLSDLGITFPGSLAELPLPEGRVEIWGVPADHQVPPAGERRPFLTTPSTCGPLPFTLRARSRQAGASWLSATAETSPPQGGCESLPFHPELGLSLSNPEADSPTGLQMELLQPEAGKEGALASAQLKEVTVQLPAGMTVSPAGVQGRSACSDGEFGLGGTEMANCPSSSATGSVQISSPSFDEPLSGTVYLGEEQPGQRFRLLVAVQGPGLVLKLVGILHANPTTGRLSVTLSNLPQAALTRVVMSLNGGPSSLIASPLACGPTTASAEFVPYGGGPTVSSIATVAIAARAAGLRCPRPLPFAPRLVVKQSVDQAGSTSTLSATLLREDGELLPRRFSIVLPAGLTAALASVPVCSATQAAASACPPASQVGAVVAGAGPGSPVQLPGEVYLTGRYRNAPFGLLFEIDARLGPFDLGPIDFRAAVDLNNRNGSVTVTSGSIPETIAGVQLRLRSMELSLDRPGLLRNPTSCGAAKVGGTVEAASGTSASISGPFEVDGCGRLRFGPRFSLGLKGADRRRGAQVELRLRVQMRTGETNLRALHVSLPSALSFDMTGIGAICSLPDARDGECPSDARIGTVEARSPLLDEQLKGGAYVVDPGDDGSPDVWFSLAHAGIALELGGTTQMQAGRFALSLSGLPDMPLTVLELRLGRVGGGVLSLSRTLCAGGGQDRLTSSLVADGQDGAERKQRLAIATPCPVERRSRQRHASPGADRAGTR